MFRKMLNKVVRVQAARIEAETRIRTARVWTAVRLALRKVELQLLYGELATHLESSAAERRRCGLKYAPSKSALHVMITMLQHLGKKFMDTVVLGISAEDHIGDLHGDSTGFGLFKYKSWYNAKYGELSCHD